MAQGDILYRGAAAWSRLAAGTSGYFLKSNGAAADPSWSAASGLAGNGMAFVGGTTLGAQATTISVGSLDIDTDQAYYIRFELKGNSVGPFDMSFFLNANTTTTDYDTQKIVANGVSNSSTRANSANVATGFPTAGPISGHMWLQRNQDGKASHFMMFSSGVTTTIAHGINYSTYRTSANVTSVQFTATVANSLATGSALNVWRIHT